MFKKHLFLIFIAILTSCGDDSWMDEIQKQVNVYNKTAKAEEEYLIEANLASNILLKKYAERYGLQKIVTVHVSPEIMEFERHFFIKDQRVIYTHYIGIARRISRSKEQDFLIFNEQSFWKDTENGRVLKQQAISDDFKNKDEVMELLDKTDILSEDVSANKYLEIQEYYNEVISMKPKK